MKLKRLGQRLTIGLLLGGLITTQATPVEALNLGPTATYLVRVTPAAKAAAEAAIGKIGGNVEARYNYVFDGFKIKLPTVAYTLLSRIPNVLSIEEDKPLDLLSPEYVESPTPSWGLDRIDQRGAVGSPAPYVSSYGYKSAGRGATIYVADTGVSAHDDLSGRLSTSGYSGYSDGNGFNDCNGHGTHVATIAAGSKYGVAKNATVVAVRVLGCDGQGTVAGVISGLDWILSPLNPNPKTAAVVNMSLGGGASASLDGAIERLTNAGMAVVVAAGNSNADACLASPARAATAITVGATEMTDAKASYSNWGACVDINAPGSSITAGWIDSPSSTRTINGTSMATPHVTGAAAIFYGLNPTASVAQLTQFLDAQATIGAIKNLSAGTPNKLLYVSPTDGAAPLTMPTAALKTVAGITSESATVSYDVNPGGDDTTLVLQFGTDPTFVSGVRAIDLGSVTGYDAVVVSTALRPLTPSTRFYVRMQATNSKGTSTSASSSFVTLPPPVIAPSASDVVVSEVTAYSARLQGNVKGGNALAQVRFMYTTDATFATGVSTVSASPASVTGNTSTSVSLPISFLTGGSTYYVKLAATNPTSTTFSEVVTFRTSAAAGIAPTVTTLNILPNPMSVSGGRFKAEVNPQSQTTTVKLVYGYTTGLSTGATTVTLPDQITGASPVVLEQSVTAAFTPGKTLYFRFDAFNASGYTKGAQLVAIIPPIAPVIKNTYASAQTTISAKFTASVNPGASNTYAKFEYTTDPDFKTGIKTVDAIPSIVNGANDVSPYANVGDLQPDTWYYFRVKLAPYTGPASGTVMYGPIMKVQTLRPTVVVTPSPSPTPTTSPSPSPTPSPSPSPTPTTGKLGQTISFAAIGDREFGPGIALTATASSKLPVIYATSTPTICQILDLGAGNFSVQTAAGLQDVDTATCTVVASQPGNATYAAAAAVSQSFTWRRAAMKIVTSIPTSWKSGTIQNLNAFLMTVDSKLMSGLYSLNSLITVVTNTPSTCLVDSTGLISVSNPYTQNKIKVVGKGGTCQILLTYPKTMRRDAVSVTVTAPVTT